MSQPSSRLLLRLVAEVGATAAGSVTSIEVDGPDDVARVQSWCEATGNTVLAVLPDAVEVVRGRIDDPLAALPIDRRPGYRLWVYTNFHCNLSCDYCCVSSSPKAEPRTISVEAFKDLLHEASDSGVQELYVTGGEPFMLLDLDERLRAATAVMPTTVLTNAMIWRGERLRRLESLPRENLTLQISLDSASSALHDRHRGEGSFDRAIAGITTARDLGFRIRVAATLGSDAGNAEHDLQALFDELGLDKDQRVVRRLAKQGSANAGLSLSRTSLIPEVCVTGDGVYWHPVAATNPAMKVCDDWSPLAQVIEGIADEYRAYRVRGDVLASTFPCA